VLESSIKAGAHGGTVIFGRGGGIHEQQTLLFVPIEPEKEIVLTLTYPEQVVRSAASGRVGARPHATSAR